MSLGRLFFALLFLSLPALAADGQTPNRKVVAEIALGGSLSTGNTDRQGLDLDAKVKHRAGRVEDTYKLLAELGREDGTTTSQRWVAGVETNIDVRDGLYALAFAQYEDDKFSGFQSEAEGGLGVGYRVLRTATMNFSVEAGPGYRIGRVRAPLPDEKQLFARGTATFDWQMSDNAKLSDELVISWDQERTKVENTLAVTSKLIGALSGRASVNLRHNTRPPDAGIKKTDTISKVALVYSF
jgi:putative salt-induced outer membrane protein